MACGQQRGQDAAATAIQLAEQGDLDAAEDLFLKAVDAARSDPAAEPRRTAQLLEYLAQVQLELGNTLGAIQHAQAAVHLMPQVNLRVCPPWDNCNAMTRQHGAALHACQYAVGQKHAHLPLACASPTHVAPCLSACLHAGCWLLAVAGGSPDTGQVLPKQR